MRISAFLLTLSLFAAAPAAQTAWIVSSTLPGADFTDIQLAIDAAVSGETVIVRSGSYNNFEIDGKALTIVAEDGVNSPVLGLQGGGSFVRVKNLTAGQTVTLRGLTIFSGQVFAAFSGIHLSNNAGTVWLESIDLQMFNPFSTGIDDVIGIRAESSSSVVLIDCTVEGHRASEALLVENSTVYAYGGHYEGGPGGNTFIPPTLYFGGGDGARLVSGELFASSATFDGGAGGDSTLLICNAPTDGGNGVQVQGGVFRDLDASFAAGVGGSSAVCSQPDALNGQPVAENGGTRVTIAGNARRLATNSPVYGGDMFTQTFSAAPFEFAFTRMAFGTIPATFVPDVAGPALMNAAPNPRQERDGLDAELLAGHTGWIRALAPELVRDPHVADDLAQETMLIALERPLWGAGFSAS